MNRVNRNKRPQLQKCRFEQRNHRVIRITLRHRNFPFSVANAWHVTMWMACQHRWHRGWRENALIAARCSKCVRRTWINFDYNVLGASPLYASHGVDEYRARINNNYQFRRCTALMQLFHFDSIEERKCMMRCQPNIRHSFVSRFYWISHLLLLLPLAPPLPRNHMMNASQQ